MKVGIQQVTEIAVKSEHFFKLYTKTNSFPRKNV
jgi:hypothetical protein